MSCLECREWADRMLMKPHILIPLCGIIQPTWWGEWALWCAVIKLVCARLGWPQHTRMHTHGAQHNWMQVECMQEFRAHPTTPDANSNTQTSCASMGTAKPPTSACYKAACFFLSYKLALRYESSGLKVTTDGEQGRTFVWEILMVWSWPLASKFLWPLWLLPSAPCFWPWSPFWAQSSGDGGYSLLPHEWA